MTCIVGFVDRNSGRVYMGGDSQATNPTSLLKRNRVDGKVFIKKCRDGIEMLFGFTQSFRMGQLLKNKLIVPRQHHRDDFTYMCSDFIDAVIECLEVNKFAKIDCNEIAGGEFLVGYRGKLYHIDVDFHVGIQKDPYDAIGTGADIALGCMYCLNRFTKFTPEAKIEAALEAASLYNAGVSGPHSILSVI